MPSLLLLTLASICVGFCRPITAATSVSASSAVELRRPVAAPKMIDSGEMIFVLVTALSVARSTGVRGGGAVQKNPIDF
jgi:hypothetical protein